MDKFDDSLTLEEYKFLSGQDVVEVEGEVEGEGELRSDWWKKPAPDVLENVPEEFAEAPTAIIPEAEPPAELLATLLPFQRESLFWMKAQERNTAYRGGILADEMGMGKTVQAIALILAHRDDGPLPPDTHGLHGSGKGPAIATGALAYTSAGVLAERKLYDKVVEALVKAARSAAVAIKKGPAPRASTSVAASASSKASAVMPLFKPASAIELSDDDVVEVIEESVPSAELQTLAARRVTADAIRAAIAVRLQAEYSAREEEPLGADAEEEGASGAGGAAPSAAGSPARKQAKERAVKLAKSIDKLQAIASKVDKKTGACPFPSVSSEVLTVFLAAHEEDFLAFGADESLVEEAERPKHAELLPSFVSTWKPLPTAISPLDTLAAGAKLSKTTLVVCPVVALTQWRSEIAKHAGSALKVMIYHGAGRSTTPEVLTSYDVVLTTYSILEAEFRKCIEPTKVTCEWCSKRFLPAKLRIHVKYFCGPDAVRTEKQSKQDKKNPRAGGGKVLEEAEEDEEEASDSEEEEAEEQNEEEEEDEEGSPPRKKGSAAKKSTPSKVSPSTTTSKKAAAPSSGKASKASSGVGKGAPKAMQTAGSTRKLVLPGSGGAGRGAATPAPSKSAAKSKGSAPRGRKRKADESDTEDEDDDYSEGGAGVEAEEEEGEGDSDVGQVEEEEGASGGGGASSARKRKRGASDSAAGGKGAPVAPALKLGPVPAIQRVFWKRIILDEAHAIKNKRAGTSKAVYALTAERRWAMSGTPLQNRVSELFSMVRYLRVAPFCNYFCKNCPCASLDYSYDEGGKQCLVCGHSPLRHFAWLNAFVMNPIRQFGFAGPGLDAMRTLRGRVLDGMVLRRTKAGRAADLALPHRNIILRDDLEMDAYEADFYAALYTQSKARFGAYVASGTLLSNYAHLFELLTRLRQAVDHPYLIAYGQAAIAAGGGAAADASDVCGICREAAEDPVLTGCRHIFCRGCMREYLEGVLGGTAAASLLKDRTNDAAAFIGGEEDGGEEEEEEDLEEEEGEGAGAGHKGKGKGKGAGKAKGKGKGAGKAKGKGKGGGAAKAAAKEEDVGPMPTCPTCFTPLTVDLTSPPAGFDGGNAPKRKGILANIPRDRVGSGFKSSTKIEALLQSIWEAQEEEPGSKSLVFSQFTGMLDLIAHRLAHAGVRLVKLDGGMSVPARDRVITAFRDDPHITVFLISLKAGGVALNLTAASRIFLME